MRVRWDDMVWPSSKRLPRAIKKSRLESGRRTLMTKVAVREAEGVEGVEGRSGLEMTEMASSRGFFPEAHTTV